MGTTPTTTRTGTSTRARRAIDRLPEIGQRRTIARQLVLDALDEGGGHLSATDIYTRIADEHSTVTLSTVYRTLGTLVDCGLVHVLNHGTEARYGFADQPHHHAVCTRCGKATEIPAAAIAEILPRLEAISHLAVATDGITVTGLCRTCAQTVGRAKKSAARRA